MVRSLVIIPKDSSLAFTARIWSSISNILRADDIVLDDRGIDIFIGVQDRAVTGIVVDAL